MAMVVLCCSLRGGFARAAGWSDGFRQVASFSASVVFEGLQPSLEGHGPQRACGRSGANLDTARLGPTQCQRAQARHVHREVCERIGRDQPMEMGEGAVSERLPSFDGFR